MSAIPEVPYRLGKCNAKGVARVPPTVLSGPWRGTLVISNLNHVVHRDWMTSMRVTDVHNCIGPFEDAFRIARQHEIRGVDYRYWSVGHGPTLRETYEEHCRQMARILSQGDRVLLVHCVSGRDRSAFAIAFFLVEEFGYTISQACATLDAHRGSDDRPLQRVREFSAIEFLEEREMAMLHRRQLPSQRRSLQTLGSTNAPPERAASTAARSQTQGTTHAQSSGDASAAARSRSTRSRSPKQSLRMPTRDCQSYVTRHLRMENQGQHVYQQSERIVPQGVDARQRLEEYFGKPIYSREAFQNMERIIRERLPWLPEDTIFCHPPGHQDVQQAADSIAACQWCWDFQKKRGHQYGLQLRAGQLVFLACETRSEGKRKTNDETTVLRIKEPLSRDSSGAETGSHKICYAVDIETWDLSCPDKPCRKSDGNFVLKLSKWSPDVKETLHGCLGELALWLSLPHGKEFKTKYGGLGFAQVRCGGFLLHYQACSKPSSHACWQTLYCFNIMRRALPLELESRSALEIQRMYSYILQHKGELPGYASQEGYYSTGHLHVDNILWMKHGEDQSLWPMCVDYRFADEVKRTSDRYSKSERDFKKMLQEKYEQMFHERLRGLPDFRSPF